MEIGSVIEVSSDKLFHCAWYVATLVDKYVVKKRALDEKNRNVKYVVKYDTLLDKDNLGEAYTEVVDPSFIRPLPPRDSGRTFELFEVVEAYMSNGWWIGVVTKIVIDGGAKKYIVSFERSNLEFERSNLRPHVDWVNRCWQVPPKKTREHLGDGNAAYAIQNTREPMVSQKGKRGRPSKAIVLHEGSTYVRPPPDKSPNHASLTTSRTTIIPDYQQDWPFIKQSPIWATFESDEVYLTPPQKPHFSPLEKEEEDSREGLAIAQIVTYSKLVKRLANLRIDVPVDTFNKSLKTLLHLETHGFNVDLVRGRFNEMLSLKLKVEPHMSQLTIADKKIEKCQHEKLVLNQENGHLKGKEKELHEKMKELKEEMKELQGNIAKNETMLKVEEEENARLLENRGLVSNQIDAWKLAFETLAATHL